MQKMFRIVKGYILSLGVFLFLTFVLAVILRNTGMPLQFAMPFGILVCTAAAFLFGMVFGSTFEKRGLFFGFFSAVLFMGLLTVLAAAAVQAEAVSLPRNPWFVIPVIVGGVGGIAGVNLKK